MAAKMLGTSAIRTIRVDVFDRRERYERRLRGSFNRLGTSSETIKHSQHSADLKPLLLNRPDCFDRGGSARNDIVNDEASVARLKWWSLDQLLKTMCLGLLPNKEALHGVWAVNQRCASYRICAQGQTSYCCSTQLMHVVLNLFS